MGDPEGGVVATFYMEHNHTNTTGGGYVSPSSSSPPTPPSPLPISVGPGNRKYDFSSSPSPSPPFSPHTSTENLPLLCHQPVPSAFSLDLPPPQPHQLDSRTSCLQDLLEWLIQKCCNCCSKSP